MRPASTDISMTVSVCTNRSASYVSIPVDAGDFSLIDRRVVEALNGLPENNRFIRGLRAWVGFKQTGVPYVRPERMFGHTTNSLLKNLGWARKAILNVARWSGSSMNLQQWTFIVIRDRADRERLAELAPYARHVAGAAVAIAIAMTGDNPEWDAYDEGRVAERILIAAGALDLGAGIGWALETERPQVAEILGLTSPQFVRTIISLGHPTEGARRPRSAPGTARRPLAELVREC